MKQIIIVISGLAFIAFTSPVKKTKVWLSGDSTMSVKETKAYPETGWGMPFANFFDSTIEVDNRAKNGRSTKSFMAEGLWQPVVDGLREGDYVFIQFGHNDEVKTKATYTTEEEFAVNLIRYVTEARSKKAIPVLLTPVARRKFDSTGQVQGTHEVYSNLVREVARKQAVPLIDLDAKSQSLLQRTGPDASRYFFNHLEAGEHPNYPDGKKDDTHFNEYGARRMAELVLQGIKENNLDLTAHILKATLPGPSTAGITNVPDTSFTTYSAYLNTKKTAPGIKIVAEVHSPLVAEAKNITYCSVSTRNLLLDVFYPAARAKKMRPAIMIIYGGGWRSGNRAQHYPLAQHLARLGYVCFTPDYRLSAEALYPAAVYDLKSALRWISANAKKYGVDTTKIAVMGFSAGGELAAFLGTTINNPLFEKGGCYLKGTTNLAAIIDLDGTLSFVHPESGEGDDSKRTSAATYWFGYAKKDNPELWKEASPLTHVSRNTPPTLFINSSVARMHAGRDDYMKVLQQSNIYTDVKTFADAPHSFPLFDPWFGPTVTYTDEFLKKVFSSQKN